MIMSFKVLKYFSSGKIRFFLFASLFTRSYLQDLKLEKYIVFFSEISTCPPTQGLIEKTLIEKGLLFPEKKHWFVAGICLI